MSDQRGFVAELLHRRVPQIIGLDANTDPAEHPAIQALKRKGWREAAVLQAMEDGLPLAPTYSNTSDWDHTNSAHVPAGPGNEASDDDTDDEQEPSDSDDDEAQAARTARRNVPSRIDTILLNPLAASMSGNSIRAAIS